MRQAIVDTLLKVFDALVLED
ncbi:hypothetical protein AGR7A_pTi0041 [Agrobacterium deltaense NCPPB 1641]|uniref:Uncharacterized protein n=1 Tax=Agrobacterium deltaense NCPPB 1641 TaxID=1183425 RepID=A0A1S7UCJ2_9HYPH|nr:hypothetical protein AGR7A_pTi0041 [Agrobacterium deltaense NCPPB 1641]